MTKAEILEYYGIYGGTPTHFLNMLQAKAYHANRTKTKVMAGNKLRTGKELGQMLEMADDLITEGLIK